MTCTKSPPRARRHRHGQSRDLRTHGRDYPYLETGATSFIARVQLTAIHAHGAIIHLAFDPAHLHLFGAEKEHALV